MELGSWEVEPLRPVIEEMFRSLDPARLVSSSLSIEGGFLRIRGLGVNGWDEATDLGLSKGRTAVISVGKAAPRMIEGALSELIRSVPSRLGPLLCLSPHAISPEDMHPDVTYLQGGHPFPGPGTAANVSALIGTVSGLGKDDSVLFLLSGGASALTLSPIEGIKESEKVQIIRTMMLSGANIVELNTVRRALSSIKGGGLLRSFRGRAWVTLALSDVMDDDPRIVGSGPTYPWKVSYVELRRVLSKYIPASEDIETIFRLASSSGDGDRSIGPFTLRNLLIASNTTAVDSLSTGLMRSGLFVHKAIDRYTGEARSTSKELLDEARSVTSGTDSDAFVKGGEATVKVRGTGRGGRCSEMALSLLPMLREGETVAFLTTDGKDGNWDGGGAVIRGCDVDPGSIAPYLERSDSGTFFDRFGGKVSMGPTMNNLGDIFVYIRAARRVLPSREGVLDSSVDTFDTFVGPG